MLCCAVLTTPLACGVCPLLPFVHLSTTIHTLSSLSSSPPPFLLSKLKKNTYKQADDPQTAALKPTITQQLWDAGRRRYVCEPLFVPRPNPSAEDDGWVLAILHNAESDKGELVILDAQRVGDGPLATIRLPHHLAAGLHGSFSPQVLLRGWEEAAGRAWTEANVVRGI